MFGRFAPGNRLRTATLRSGPFSLSDRPPERGVATYAGWRTVLGSGKANGPPARTGLDIMEGRVRGNGPALPSFSGPWSRSLRNRGRIGRARQPPPARALRGAPA